MTKKYKEIRKIGERKFQEETSKNKLVMLYRDALLELKDQEGLIKEEYLEKVKCPISNDQESTILFTKDGFNFVQSKISKLIYINPQLNQAGLTKIHSNSKVSNFYLNNVLQSTIHREFDDRKFLNAISEIKPYLPNQPWVLDVGCSGGAFLNLCKHKGFKCEGVEISKVACEWGKENYNLSIHNSSWEEFETPKEKYDLLSFWASHSYTKLPVYSLKKAYDAIKKGWSFANAN